MRLTILSIGMILSCLFTQAQIVPGTAQFYAVHGEEVVGQQAVRDPLVSYVGYTNIAGTSATVTADRMRLVSSFVLSGSATADRIDIYSANSLAGQDVKVAIYAANASHQPTTLKVSSAFTDVGTWTASWKEFSIPTTVLPPGEYWVGFIVSTTGSLTRYLDAVGTTYYDDYAYTEATRDPFYGTANGVGTFSIRVRITQ